MKTLITIISTIFTLLLVFLTNAYFSNFIVRADHNADIAKINTDIVKINTQYQNLEEKIDDVDKGVKKLVCYYNLQDSDKKYCEILK